MIQMGQEEAHIRMFLQRKDMDHRLDMHMKKNKPKGVAIDGVPIHKSSETLTLKVLTKEQMFFVALENRIFVYQLHQ